MRRIILAMLLATAAISQPASAGKSHQVRFIGIHPVPKSEGGGICYIEGPHVHIYAANKLEYRDHHGANYFVGDPVAYGYDGPKHVYRGHHPIHVNVVVGDDDDDTEFCYLDGPHYHYFEPPSGPEFKVVGDAYFYVGEPPPVYVEARPAMIKVNAIYTPLVYTRPVVEVEPPEGWIGVRFGGPAVVVAPVADVEVRGPAVRVRAERPHRGSAAAEHLDRRGRRRRRRLRRERRWPRQVQGRQGPQAGLVMRAALLLVLLASCSKSDTSANASPFGEPAGPRDAVIDAWKKGGLTPSPLTAATVSVGKDCQSGTVGAVDVLLCAYPTPEEAKAAEETGLTWVGDATGSSQAHGKVLVVVADRRKSDPSGRTINQMMKLAPK